MQYEYMRLCDSSDRLELNIDGLVGLCIVTETSSSLERRSTQI